MVREGTYFLSKTITFTTEDSGTEKCPITYMAHPKEKVVLSGGKVLTGFHPVTDPAVLNRLDEAARGKVLQTDLRSQDITEYGELSGGFGIPSEAFLDLFFQDRPMTIARWPNEGFVNIADILNIDPVDVRGTSGDKVGKFIYEGDRPKRWVEEKDLWLHGYWFRDWADQRQKVESIDTEKHIISLVPPYHKYGYRSGQWYYAFNVLAELDTPGEWYMDRETGILYFWPPAPIEKGKPTVSFLPTLVTMKDTSHVTIHGMTLEAVQGTAITITNCGQNQIIGCTLRNIGNWAVKISGGMENSVIGCDIYETGDGGIALSGGDRKTLTPARHYAGNNHIHHYSRWNRMYQPAISLSGVGNRASYNLIHNAPHMAIYFSGNDHAIEFNEIHNVCYESNDAGAIYAGRDWTMRGTVIRHNYLHHINGFQEHGCVGVYLDDMFCGTEISGNVFYKVTRPAFIGGGRDNIVKNNIFVDCKPAVHVDARAMGWAKSCANNINMKGLLAMPYQSKLWHKRYPKLVTILEGDPNQPKGNVIWSNVCQGGKWDEIEDKARPLVTLQDNLIDAKLRFAAPEKGNFKILDDKPLKKIGFKRIPMKKIGLKKKK